MSRRPCWSIFRETNVKWMRTRDAVWRRKQSRRTKMVRREAHPLNIRHWPRFYMLLILNAPTPPNFMRKNCIEALFASLNNLIMQYFWCWGLCRAAGCWCVDRLIMRPSLISISHTTSKYPQSPNCLAYALEKHLVSNFIMSITSTLLAIISSLSSSSLV